MHRALQTLGLWLGLGVLVSNALAQRATPTPAPEGPPADEDAAPARGAEASGEASPAEGAAPDTATPDAATPEAATEAAAPAEQMTEAPAPEEDAQDKAETPRRPAPRQAPRELLEAARRARARLAARSNYRDEDPDTQPEVRGDAGAAFAVGLVVELPFSTDSSYDVFDDDDVEVRYGLWVAHDVVTLRRDLIAALELGWAFDSLESNVFAGTLRSELDQHWFHAGAALRYVPLSWLQPQLRLLGGVSRADVAFETSGPDERFEDGAFLPFGRLGAGVLLRTPTRTFEDRSGRLAGFSLGLLVEGGYTLVAPMAIELDGPGPRRDDIPLRETDLGELDRSGPYLRFALVTRF